MNIHTHKLIISRDVIFNEVFDTHTNIHSFLEDNDTKTLMNPVLFQHQPTFKSHSQQLPLMTILPQTPIQSASSVPQDILSPPGPLFTTLHIPNIYSQIMIKRVL